jgi:hypothetical protein
VIDRAGAGINVGDDGGSTTANNRVWDNVVSNSTGENGQYGWLPPVMLRSPGLSSTSVGNDVHQNDSFNNTGGLAQIASSVTSSQLAVTNNITADPQFVDAASHDYSVKATSPAAGWGLWNGG